MDGLPDREQRYYATTKGVLLVTTDFFPNPKRPTTIDEEKNGQLTAKT